MMDPQLRQRAAKIRLLLMDVDGVLTNGLLYNVPGPEGGIIETKAFASFGVSGPTAHICLSRSVGDR